MSSDSQEMGGADETEQVGMFGMTLGQKIQEFAEGWINRDERDRGPR